MLLNLTEEQIVQLAPDTSSVKAAKGLATESKWILRASGTRALWGHCQGSGKTPYQTVIDTQDLAFKCSCPSRKFPCKHGLGLLLLYAARPELFGAADEPEWISEWLAKRDQKAEKKEQKTKGDAPVDEAAQARRQAQRHKNVMQGIDDLQVWLKDLLRNGLLQVPERADKLFEGMARRMVDAQAPGLAGRLRALGEMDFTGESWKALLTERLGKLWLLTEAYRHLERRSEVWQCEIRTLIGYPQTKEEVLAGEAVADRWMVLHKRVRRVDQLKVESYWLYGERSGRMAVYLEFLAPKKIPEMSLVPGDFYDGELCFYSGVGSLRALFRSHQRVGEGGFVPAACSGLEEAAAWYRAAVGENPFIDEVPTVVDGLRLAEDGTRSWVVDAEGKRFPVRIREEIRIPLLVTTGGKPFRGFLLADEEGWELLSIWNQPNDEFYCWRDERD